MEDGTSRVKKKYIKLSLDDNEVKHFIASRDPRYDADEEFTISEDRGEGSDYLAVLRLSSVPSEYYSLLKGLQTQEMASYASRRSHLTYVSSL